VNERQNVGILALGVPMPMLTTSLTNDAFEEKYAFFH
jgi:hypothetical protein